MLSQFKYNLRQAVSCLLIHKQALQVMCQSTLEPLSPYIKQILPPKSYTAFSGILTSLTFATIDEFYVHIHKLEQEMIESPLIAKSRKMSISNENSFTAKQYQSRFPRKRLKSIRKIHTQFQTNSQSQNNITIGNWVSNQDFVDLAFREYKRVDEGNKKVKSFEEKELFKTTLNYHKIIRLLEDMGVPLTPDQRLKLLIMVKKNSQESNYMKKEEFGGIYEEIRKLMKISDDVQTGFYRKRQGEIEAKKRLFSRKLEMRSMKKGSSNFEGGRPRIHQSEKTTFKITPSKLKVERSFIQKTLPPILKAKDQKQLINSSVIQKSVLETRLEKLRVHVNNWENLNKIKEENNMLKNILMAGMELDMDSDEDEYYLREYYKSNGVENEAKSMKQRNNLHPGTGNQTSLETSFKGRGGD